jgi:II/X family phage/plasmid replication protein
MLDWFTGLVGYDGAALKLNRFMEVTPEGEIRSSFERRMPVKSSFETNVLVGRSSSTEAMRKASDKYILECADTVLEISGNPVKWFQGHNAYGVSVSQLSSVILDFVRALPEGMRPPDADSPLWPAVHRSRVDTTVMVGLDSHNIVHEWLQVAGSTTRSAHGRPMVSGDTVYWGAGSRRWRMKAYCKFCELEAHRPKDVRLFSLLKDATREQLRLEL